MFGSAPSAARTQSLYRRLSACARGDHTAGPRLRLSSRNWMPVASIAVPIKPPSASISRTRWPFAVPPTAGLHGMCATVDSDSVQIATVRPSRAAAHAASAPAWPAPITITSKSGNSRICLVMQTNFRYKYMNRLIPRVFAAKSFSPQSSRRTPMCVLRPRVLGGERLSLRPRLTCRCRTCRKSRAAHRPTCACR